MEYAVIYLLMVKKLLKSKGKNSEINAIPLCLSNISKYFSADNMIKIGFICTCLWF